MPGIDDAAFFYNSSYRANYSDTVVFCQRFGGKVFEPTEATHNLVYEWSKEKSKSKYRFWLGIKWSEKHSEFQYQSNGTKISWSNFYDTSLTITCGWKSCVNDNASVLMDSR